MRSFLKRHLRPTSILLAGTLVATAAVAGPALGLWHVGKTVDPIKIPRGQVGFTVTGPASVGMYPLYASPPSATPEAIVSAGEAADPAMSQRRVRLGTEVAVALDSAAGMVSAGQDAVLAIPISVRGYSDGNVGLRYLVSFVGFDDGTSVLGNSRVAVRLVDNANACTATSNVPPGSIGPLSEFVPDYELVASNPSSVYEEETLCLTIRYEQVSDGVYENRAVFTAESSNNKADSRWNESKWSIEIGGPDPTLEPDSWLIITPKLFRPGDTDPPIP